MSDGAHKIARSALSLGFRQVVGNPGTTELPLVHAFREQGVDYILALHENAATGIAYGLGWRIGTAPLVLLHATPGLANGLCNIYSAWRSGVPMVVLAGQQDSRFLLKEPALSSRLTEIAEPVTKWAYQVQSAEELSDSLARAKYMAESSPQGPVFLAIPYDLLTGSIEGQGAEVESRSGPLPMPRSGEPLTEDLDAAISMILEASEPVVVLGDSCASRTAHEEILEFVRFIGAPMYSQPFMARNVVPTTDPLYKGALGISGRSIRNKLGRHDLLIAIAGPHIVPSLFSREDPIPPLRSIQIAESSQEIGLSVPVDHALIADVKSACAALRVGLNERASESTRNVWGESRRQIEQRSAEIEQERSSQSSQRGSNEGPILDPATVVSQMSDLLPPDVVIFDEGVSASGDLIKGYPFSRPNTYAAGSRGGGLGLGVPAGVGLALTAEREPSVVFTGDGSALYTIQALWTAARYQAPVVVVVCNNSGYAILKAAMRASGVPEDSEGGDHELQIDEPPVDFVSLAIGFGVAASHCETTSELRDALERALSRPGPSLIEVATPPVLPSSPQH